MVQDQLVDYISSQMKLGVSREAIKSALLSAGWVAGDVEDTLKKIEGAAKPMPAATPAISIGNSPATTSPSSSIATAIGTGTSFVSKPAQTSSSPTSSPTGMGGINAAKPAGTQPQMMRVSDLVSSTPASGSTGPSASSIGGGSMASKYSSISPKVTAVGGAAGIGTNVQKTTKIDSMPSGSAKGGKAGVVIAVIIALIFAGLAGYFYMANAALASKVSTLTTQSTSVNGQLTSLQSQIASSSSVMAGQVATLTSSTNELALELSFYAVPVGQSATTPISVTIDGVLSGGAGPYSILAPRGAKIFISSATNSKTLASLKALIGDNVQISGTYVPGSDQITATTVLNLAPVAMTTTSTATSTSASASSTAASSTTKNSTSSKPVGSF